MYGTWKKQCGHDTNMVKQNWFFTGGAGTLLPPHIFGEEMYDDYCHPGKEGAMVLGKAVAEYIRKLL